MSGRVTRFMSGPKTSADASVAAPGSARGQASLERLGSAFVIPTEPASIYEHTIMARPNFGNRHQPADNHMFIIGTLLILRFCHAYEAAEAIPSGGCAWPLAWFAGGRACTSLMAPIHLWRPQILTLTDALSSCMASAGQLGAHHQELNTHSKLTCLQSC